MFVLQIATTLKSQLFRCPASFFVLERWLIHELPDAKKKDSNRR